MDFPAILTTQLLTNSYLGFTRFYKHFICLFIVLRNFISCLVLYNHQSEHRALPWPQRSCYHFMIIPHHLPPSPRLTSGNLWPVLYNLVTVRIVHKWDYTVCYILWLAFFFPTQYNALKIHPRFCPVSPSCLSLHNFSKWFPLVLCFQNQLHNDDSLVFISKLLEI